MLHRTGSARCIPPLGKEVTCGNMLGRCHHFAPGDALSPPACEPPMTFPSTPRGMHNPRLAIPTLGDKKAN